RRAVPGADSPTASPVTSASSSGFLLPAEDGIRARNVTGVQTCALPIFGIALAGTLPIDLTAGTMLQPAGILLLAGLAGSALSLQIGRASCRERASGGAGAPAPRRRPPQTGKRAGRATPARPRPSSGAPR